MLESHPIIPTPAFIILATVLTGVAPKLALPNSFSELLLEKEVVIDKVKLPVITSTLLGEAWQKPPTT